MFVSYRVVSLTPLALVRFRLACCSGLPLVSRFFLLFGSGLVRLRRVPSVSLCAFSSRAFPTACLLSAPSHPSGSVGSSPFARPSPLLGDSVAVSCHPIGVLPCFATSASAFRRSLSARLVSSPRSVLSRRPPSRLSVCLLHSSRSRAALVAVLPLCGSRVGLALVPSFAPPCLSSGGAVIEAVAVCGPGVSLLAPVMSASVVSVRSHSPAPSCLGLLAWWHRVVSRSAALWSRRAWRSSLAIRLSPRFPRVVGRGE